MTILLTDPFPVDGIGTTKYTYDAVGQLLSEGGLWADDAMSYTYNNRLRTGLSLQAPNAPAWTQSYLYDTARRLTNVTSPAGAFGYAYDTVRSTLWNKLSLPGGACTTNTYDSVARMLSTTLKGSSGSVLNSNGYTYNPGNQRTQQVFTAGNYINYTYDNIGQVKTALGKEPGGATNRLQEQFGYAYDAAGDLNWRTNNALIEAFDVNNLDELTTATNSGTLTVAGTTTSPATNVTVNGSVANCYQDSTFALGGFAVANGSNTFTAVAQDSYGRLSSNTVSVYLPATNIYSYDLNGNLLSDGTRNFAYDDENQLIAVWVTNAWESRFAYDGKMRLRTRQECTWSGGAWVQTNEVNYLYDGMLPLQWRDINNLPLMTQTRGNDLSGSLQGAGGIGGLLARTDNQLFTTKSTISTSLYHCDGNGNVTCLIYTNQQIAARYEYDPFGNVLSQSGPLADANLYRFSSKEYHPNSGLIYYGYRFYGPSLQRWLNRDPAAKADDPNLYTFVFNNPNTLYDSLGLCVPLPDSGPGHLSTVWEVAHKVLNRPPNSLTFTVCCPLLYPYLSEWTLTSPVGVLSFGKERFPGGWTPIVTPVGSHCFQIYLEVPWHAVKLNSAAVFNGIRVKGSCCCTPPDHIQGPPTPPEQPLEPPTL